MVVVELLEVVLVGLLAQLAVQSLNDQLQAFVAPLEGGDLGGRAIPAARL
jgi:hypothetical protein